MSTLLENLERLETAKTDIAEAIVNKGVEVGEGEGFESFAEKIENIPSGSTIPESLSLFAPQTDWIAGRKSVYSLYPCACEKFEDHIYIFVRNEVGYVVIYELLSDTLNFITEFNSMTSSISSGDICAVNLNGKFITICVNGRLFTYTPSGGVVDTAKTCRSGATTIKGENKIHAIYQSNYYVTTNGTTWNSSTLPVGFSGWTGLEIDSVLHIFGREQSSGAYSHYAKINGSWNKISTLPSYAISAFYYKNEIYIITNQTSNNRYKQYKLNGTSWESVGYAPSYSRNGILTFPDGVVMIGDNSTYTSGQIYLYTK